MGHRRAMYSEPWRVHPREHYPRFLLEAIGLYQQDAVKDDRRRSPHRAATWWTRPKIHTVFDSSHSLYYMKTWRHLQDRKYITYRIAVRGWPRHGHRNTYTKFGEIWTCYLWGIPADRQTNRQTYRHAADRNTPHPYSIGPIPGQSSYNGPPIKSQLMPLLYLADVTYSYYMIIKTTRTHQEMR